VNNGSTSASDLHARLHELHFSAQGLDSLLNRITVLAADMVDGDTSVGVTVVSDGRPTTVAASDERTKHFDEVQYAEGDGPCLEAARSGGVVTVHDSASDSRWPGYLAHAAEGGLRSSLSVPMRLGDEAAGALNTYVFAQHDFDDAERATIGQFCDEASRAVSLALRHERVTRENDHLHAAMATRRVIDQALGIMMAQNRCSAEEAFTILRRASQNRNVKINQLAADMIRTATGAIPDEHTHWQS
jgi:GAF domain-containing protein